MITSSNIGADGGNGGHVVVEVSEKDSYLLMAVAGCDPVEGLGDRLDGGQGGAAGRHGSPGQDGGLDVTRNRFLRRSLRKRLAVMRGKAKSLDPKSDATVQTGTTGISGETPLHHLYPGEEGRPGTFEVQLATKKGKVKTYSSRYDLCLSSVLHESISKMKVDGGIPCFEFGEFVYLREIEVKNVGGMKTPKEKVAIAVEGSDELLKADDSVLAFLSPKHAIKAGKSAATQDGFLRFELLRPDNAKLGDDFDPVQVITSYALRATQLGPIVDDVYLSDFRYEYKHFDRQRETRSIKVACPIENPNGFIGRTSLAGNESALLTFPLINTSLTSLGKKSASKRRVHVKLFRHPSPEYEIGDDQFEVRTLEGKKVSIDNALVNSLERKGHKVKIDLFRGDSRHEIIHTIKLERGTTPYAKAAIQAEIYLEDIPKLHEDGSCTESGSLSLVQRRKVVITCEPAYERKPGARAVLITSNAVTKQQFKTWMTILNEMFGLSAEVYSVTRYGHLDPHKGSVLLSVEDEEETLPATGGVPLRELFVGKLVVVLNDLYSKKANGRATPNCRPTDLLVNGLCPYNSGFDASTKWLVVGGDESTKKCLLSDRLTLPTTSSESYLYGREDETEIIFESTVKAGNGGVFDSVGSAGGTTRESHTDDWQGDSISGFRSEDSGSLVIERHSSVKAFKKGFVRTLTEEREYGLRTDSLMPRCDRITVTYKFISKPNKDSAAKTLKKVAKSLEVFLCKHDKLCPYVVETKPADKPTSLRSSPGTYAIGSIFVHRGLSAMKNPAYLIEDSRVALNSAGAITSRSMVYALLASAPWETRLACYASALRVVEGQNKIADDCRVVCKDVIALDFLNDVANFRDRRVKVPDDKSKMRRLLPTLEALKVSLVLRSLIQDAGVSSRMNKLLKDEFSDILARLAVIADASDVAMRLSATGLKTGIRGAIYKAVETLQLHWVDVLDAQTINTKMQELEHRVKMCMRTKEAALWRRVRGDKSAALRFLHSPYNSAKYDVALAVERCDEMSCPPGEQDADHEILSAFSHASDRNGSWKLKAQRSTPTLSSGGTQSSLLSAPHSSGQ